MQRLKKKKSNLRSLDSRPCQPRSQRASRHSNKIIMLHIGPIPKIPTHRTIFILSIHFPSHTIIYTDGLKSLILVLVEMHSLFPRLPIPNPSFSFLFSSLNPWLSCRQFFLYHHQITCLGSLYPRTQKVLFHLPFQLILLIPLLSKFAP